MNPELLEHEQWLAERVARRRQAFDLSRVLFGPQLAFAQDAARYVTAVCSRRAGKSVGCAAKLLRRPLQDGAPSLYFTLTRVNAKRIIWPTLLEFNRKHGLGFEANETELVLKRGGRALVHLAGADNRAEIEKWRGIGWGDVVGDEAQILPQYLKAAVEDVLVPSLVDHGGTISLIGTPGAVPVGYFYECSRSPQWSHHGWTLFENPHILNARGYLAEVLKARGLTEADPSIQREFFGRWSYDPNALVFRFDTQRNLYVVLPKLQGPWAHVVGIDLGWDDADAIAVLAFHEASPAVYLVEEQVNAKETITQLADRLQRVVATHQPQAMVVDTGGLGRKITEELASRFNLPLKAAEKPRKLEFIALLNDAMRTGRFLAPADSRFARDAMLVEWDRDKSTSDRQVISDRYHSDVGDAVLYAYRESLHWLHVPQATIAAPGSPAWAQAEADRMLQAEHDTMAREKEEMGIEPKGLGDAENWEDWARQ